MVLHLQLFLQSQKSKMKCRFQEDQLSVIMSLLKSFTAQFGSRYWSQAGRFIIWNPINTCSKHWLVCNWQASIEESTSDILNGLIDCFKSNKTSVITVQIAKAKQKPGQEIIWGVFVVSRQTIFKKVILMLYSEFWLNFLKLSSKMRALKCLKVMI